MNRPAPAIAGVLGAAVISGAGLLALAAHYPPPPRETPGLTAPRSRGARALPVEGGIVPLPPESRTLGTEAAELRALAHLDADGTTSDRTGARALFASAPTSANQGDPRLPEGLRKPELDSADVDGVAIYLEDLAKGEQTHAAMRLALRRSGQYRADVERILRAWHVPEELTAIPFVESAFVPSALAPSRGAGLWSLPPHVAEAYGLVTTPSYDERRSVALASEVAAHYLADLHERFGSWEHAVCAFGVGYPATLRAAAGEETADSLGTVSSLPAEGLAYVRAVAAVSAALANPERFGLDVQPDLPTTTSDLEIPAGAPFRLVARAAGTTAERLRELNPEYLAEAIPNAGVPMVVHLPAEGLARARELLMPLLYGTSTSEGPSPSSSRGGKGAGARPTGLTVATAGGRSYYRVRDGETLDGLAAHFGVDRASIARDNALDPTASLHAGQLLLINAPASSAGAGETHAHR